VIACLAAILLTVQTTADPSLPIDHEVGMGLDGVSYYMAYSPFNDLTKTMRFIDVARWGDHGVPAAANPGKTVLGRVGVGRGDTFPKGDYTLTWRGEGEVSLDRPKDAELIKETTENGVHRKVYRLADGPGEFGPQLRFDRFPVTDLHFYLPGRDETSGLWNPDYLRVIEPFRGTHLRFMDLNHTNHSKQKEWSDRTPVAFTSYLTEHHNRSAELEVKGRVPYEAMIELCNTLDADMWITVPHLADEPFVSNLAHLIRMGVDKATGEQVTEPLKDDLKVWVEYSNEVWNWNFSQSQHVLNNMPGEKLADKYIAATLPVFEAFEKEFGGTDRLIRILGTQSGYPWRTGERLRKIDRDAFDALAITTYFSHDMEQWAVERWPVTKDQFLEELEQRIGQGPFTASDEKGQNQDKYENFRFAKEHGVPVVSYEGNSHLVASRRMVPPGAPEGAKKQPIYNFMPEFTDFLHEVESDPRLAEIYETWLERHELSGLVANTPFVLLADWSRHGQWGHMRNLTQTLDEAPKYRMLIEHYDLPAPEPPTD
jgi:hypothetical protein